jgi:hypothetical protein
MRFCLIAIAAAVAALLSACSSGSSPAPGGSPAASAPGKSTAGTPTADAAPDAVRVSPGGVTTAIGTPAESTEDEYFRACHAAKVWMQAQGGDQKAQFEPYLRHLQSSAESGPGTFGAAWSALPLSRQSAIVVAAQAAADDLCG